MTRPTEIQGLIPAVFTPMHADGRVDLDRIPALVEHLLRQDSAALYVNGSTGEGVSMTSDERRAVAEAFVRTVNGRIPVIVQVGHNSLGEARALAAHAQATGADAISAIPPNYFRPATIDLLIDCLAQVTAGAPELPFFYYHIPGRTGVNFDMVEFLRRAGERLPTLVGMKYSHTTIYEMQACANLQNRRFRIFFGSDEMLLSGLVGGAQAAVGSTYNFLAPLYHAIIAAYSQSNIPEAQRLQGMAAELIRPINRYGGFPALKAMMSIIGVDCGPARLPYRPLSQSEIESLRQDMEALGFFDWV